MGRFIILDTGIFNVYDVSLYWTLRDNGHVGRFVILVIVTGIFIVWDVSLYWTQIYSVYVTFRYIEHCLRDIDIENVS
jgi:hypothetical protein